MPQIANLAIEKLSNPDSTPREVQDILSKDQALAARILKVANSAFYNSPRSISRISDAIGFMGFNAVRSLVITSTVYDLFKRFGLTEKLLWEHSLACASAAKRVARAIRFSKVEEAFLAGLMHDIGKIILNIKLPDQMMEIVQETYNNPGSTFYELELKQFGFTHAQVGKLVAKKWNFAEEIEEAIGNHHRPEKSAIMPALSHITSLANAFCNKLEIGPVRAPDLDLAEFPSAKALRIKQEVLDALLEEMISAGDSMKTI